MNQTTKRKTLVLVESAVMIALAAVLSLIRIVDLPYGGSVTVASMLPIMIIGYRHGLAWGLGSGLVYGVIQQLLGLKNLSYFSTWQSILAIILLDYVVAFAVSGLAGVTRRAPKDQALGLSLGALLACALRYLCHVISGATVWAGLSIPTQAALGYSLIYNATYMVPETIVTVAAAFYLGSVLALRSTSITRIVSVGRSKAATLFSALAGLVLSVAIIFDVAAVFAHLQDGETGEFTVTQLGSVNWIAVAIVSAVGVAVAVVLKLIAKSKAANA